MMIRLPLAARELNRIARGRRTYLLRFLLIGVVFFWLLTTWVVSKYSGTSVLMSAEAVGRSLSELGTLIQFTVVLVVIPALVAPLIAQERRENTLGLLMTADFRGVDIFVAKFISVFAEAECLLLATMPLMAFGTLFGGVSVALVVKQWFVLSLCGATLCSLGLFCSSVARHPISAIVLNLLLATSIVTLNILIVGWAVLRRGWEVFEVFSIPEAIAWAVDGGSHTTPAWPALILIAVIGLLAFIATLLWLPHAAVIGPRRRWFGPRKAFGATHRRLLHLGPVAPIISAYSSGFLSQLRPGLDRFITVCGLAALATIPVLGPVLVLLLLCYDITLSLTALRRDGALDDLAVTTLGEREIAREIYRFHVRRAVLYFPALLVITIQIATVYYAMLEANVLKNGVSYLELLYEAPPWASSLFTLAMILLVPVFAMVQGPCVAAVACLVGASGKASRRSGARAMVLVAVLYGLVLVACTVGQLYPLEFAFVQTHYWTPGLAAALASILLFALVGLLAYRRFLDSLSPDPGRA